MCLNMTNASGVKTVNEIVQLPQGKQIARR